MSKNKPRGRPFPKGTSGNPGGKSKSFLDVRQLARTFTAQAVHALVEALTDERSKVAAAIALLDRGYGRPQQTIDMNVRRSLGDYLAAAASGIEDAETVERESTGLRNGGVAGHA